MNLGAEHIGAGRAPIASLTREHRLEDGQVRLLGAYASVTGAMTRVEMGGSRVLVDCGVAQGNDAFDWQLDPAALDVDAILLTHAHHDHVGSLPALIERGFDGPIYGTPATLAIARLVLEDGLALEGRSPRDSARLMRELETLFRPLPLDAPSRIGNSMGFAFREAGHILGSASIELWSERSRIICSGDLGRPNSPLLADYQTRWSAARSVDLVLLESTYGDEEHQHGHEDMEAALERILLRAIERRGHVLVPGFALGQTQTLLYHLSRLVEAGRVPAIPVAVDSPLAIGITSSYSDFARVFDRKSLDLIARGDDPLDFAGLFAARRLEHSQRLGELPGPLIIIAGSGMCTGGRVVGHLRRLLPIDQSTILFVGYQAEGTPGRAIQRAAARGGRVWIDHEEVKVRAEIETLSGLSAHADRRELARWLDAIPNVRRVALHHGEPRAQRAFAAWYS